MSSDPRAPTDEAGELRRTIELERARAARLVAAIADPVVHFDRNLEVRGLNPAADRLVGSGRLEIPDDTFATLADALEAVIASGPMGTSTLEVRLLVDGEPRCFELTAVSDLDLAGNVDGVTVIARDVDVLADARASLVDPVTGLATRVRFELALTQTLQHRERRSDVVAVLVVDLDRFELLGMAPHADKGDLLLKTIADRIRRTARPNDLVARFGGNEFGVLPQSLRTHGDAMLLAERLHHAVQETRLDAGGEFVGTASIGVAFADRRRPVDAAELIDRAQEAMHEAKRTGRHRTVVHRDD
jgi:diguanylate cyclase (GGDEF)-like protein